MIHASSERATETVLFAGMCARVLETYANVFPFLADQRLVGEMAVSKQKAFCVLQFAKAESDINVQRAFRIQFGCQPPNENNILRGFHQFETTSCLCKGKRGVGTSGSERCHLHEDQAQDALDKPLVEKSTATTSAPITCAAFDAHPSTPPFGVVPRTKERNWTAAEWNQVVFSDESRLNLIRDDNRVRVWRLRGGRLNPVFALQRHIAPTAGVMGPFFNNARPHTARVSQDCLRTVTTLHWPARSPDLSPIEHIWAHLGWRVGHPTSLNELEARLQQIWKEMSQDIIQSLYASMPDRIASCIRARGGATGWQDQPNTTGCPIGHSLSYSIEKLKSPFLCKL
ncbi:transposable element Tcb2 transposase [Trichonephila clavipes]|nr:transposable element Tcb2 transposase [Trichonephila clavipes]